MADVHGKALILDPDNFTPLYDAQLSSELSQLGWQVVWVTSTPQFGQMPQPQSVRVENTFFRILKRPFWRILLRRRFLLTVRRLAKAAGYFWGLYLLYRSLCRQVPGILHVQWALFPWVDGLLWQMLRRQGWVVVYTCHDPVPLTGSLPKWFSKVTRRLCLAADGVIVHGQWAHRTLEKMGIPAARIHVIEPGAFTKSLTLEQHTARRILGLDPEVPIILFFGFIKPYKGLEILLDSLPRVRAELKKFQLLVAGEFMESVSNYRKWLAKEGLSDFVQWFEGYMPEEKSRCYFAAANTVVLPYLEASSSAVLLQAYSASRPVVASAVGDIPSMVEDQKTGLLVPPKDPVALAKAIVSILKDEETAVHMGSNGRDLLESRFNWAKAASRTEILYLQLYKERFQRHYEI